MSRRLEMVNLPAFVLLPHRYATTFNAGDFNTFHHKRHLVGCVNVSPIRANGQLAFAAKHERA